MPSVDQCWAPSQMQSLADEKDFHVLFGKLDRYIKALGFQEYSFSLVTDRFKFLIFSFPSAGPNRYALMRALESDKVLAHCCWSELPLLWNAELFHDTPERWRDLQAKGL